MIMGEVEKERTTEKRDLDDKFYPNYRESSLYLIAAPTSLTSLEIEFPTGEEGKVEGETEAVVWTT